MLVLGLGIANQVLGFGLVSAYSLALKFKYEGLAKT